MNFLQKKVSENKNFWGQLILCRQLGSHPTMIEALKERVYESLEFKNECSTLLNMREIT